MPCLNKLVPAVVLAALLALTPTTAHAGVTGGAGSEGNAFSHYHGERGGSGGSGGGGGGGGGPQPISYVNGVPLCAAPGQRPTGKLVGANPIMCQVATGGPQVNVSAIIIDLLAKIHVPAPKPKFGPDPSVNEWKMLAVGYPIWLWTDRPGPITDSVTAYGITVSVRATLVSTTFSMGDGHTVKCASTRPYVQGVTTPGTPSPVCGYTYQKASLPRGKYTVTATTTWRIDWTAAGKSGSEPMDRTASRQLPIGEIQTIITHR